MSSVPGRPYPLINAHTHWGNAAQAGSENLIVSLYSFTPGDVIEPSVQYFSCAFHPAQANVFSEEALTSMMKDPRCMAVGECGLDPFSPVPMEEQEKVFLRHMELARAAEKPLVIHCVRCYPQIISLRKKFWKKTQIPFLIHGFRGKKEQAKELVRHNFILSLSPVWLSHQETLDPVFDSASILLETDMEQGVSIADLYEKAARLCGKSVEELSEEMFRTFRRLFPGIKDPPQK